MRFIGSKEQLLPFIESAFLNHVGTGTYCVGDFFCGTAAVSRLFKRLGQKIVANDNLKLCYVLAQATLGINKEPEFERLFDEGEIPHSRQTATFTTPYDQVLSYLNRLPGEPGFIYREYSPRGTSEEPFQRQYFTDENAQRIDAIRRKIGYWQQEGLLSEQESCLLVSDLIRAADRCANIAGTYGCFIKHWDPRAKKRLVFQRWPLTFSRIQHEVFCKDAHTIAKERTLDVIYLDPPYTWRHYGAYYHILETIAEGDEPCVAGRTGLRPWQDSKSRYCHRTDAVKAMEELFSLVQCKHLFLSYNSEGLISHEEILQILGSRGKPVCHEINHRRYRSNNGGTKQNTVKERLYYVQIG